MFRNQRGMARGGNPRQILAGRRHEGPLAGTAVLGFAAGREVFSSGAGVGADPRAGWAPPGLSEAGAFGSPTGAPRIRKRGLSIGSGTSDSESGLVNFSSSASSVLTVC